MTGDKRKWLNSRLEKESGVRKLARQNGLIGKRTEELNPLLLARQTVAGVLISLLRQEYSISLKNAAMVSNILEDVDKKLTKGVAA